MKIESSKKIVSSMGKNNIINRNKVVTQHAVLTKHEAIEEIKDLYEFIYDMIEDDMLPNRKMELSQKDKFEKIRNRMGILKDCEIIIKN